MIDSPWFLGMAPLLGLCLDAIGRGTRAEPLVVSWAARATERFEFVMRTGLPRQPRRGGWFLVGWVACLALLSGWALSKLSWIVFADYGQFILWTGVYFLLFSVRRRASAALKLRQALLQGDLEVAQSWLEYAGGSPADSEQSSLARAGVEVVGEGLLVSGILVAFWGSLGGIGAALAAASIHEVACYGRRSEEPDDPLWGPAQTLERWISLPPAWVATLAASLVAPLGGGDRARTLAGFVNHFRKPPPARLSTGLIQGLGLEKVLGEQGLVDPVKPDDLQRAVVVLWTSSFVGTLGLCALACIAYKLLL